MCGWLAELEMEIANAYCDCKELTDFEFNSLTNNFCDYKELKDFCSDEGIGFNREDFEQGWPSKLTEAIPCPTIQNSFREVVEKEPTPRFGNRSLKNNSMKQ